ncbi:MAG: MFS transporter [Comamonas sp.]|nr:MFS transporter [Comamonas sp.]
MTAPVNAIAWRSGLAYGLLGFPLAFAALPLYVVLPNYYARSLGLSLATVGGLLMLVRLIDAAIEPWLGKISDALFARSVSAVLWVGAISALVQWFGMAGLFFPAVDGQTPLAAWMVLGLLLTCTAHSLLVISHQAWGVRLGGDDVLRSRIVAWREGLGLAGVIAASALTVVWGPQAMLAVFGGALLIGWSLWWRAPQPARVQLPPSATASLWEPLKQPAFRKLLAVFICNGIASAIPAALMLFFAQDRLQASEQATAVFLVLYFACGAASMPLWLQCVRRCGLAWSWLLGMLLAIVCFAWTSALGTGQVHAFAFICALTGIALGADLALPGALLARLIAQHGAQGSHDGTYLGWWSLATKLNLALAAGAALPLLQWLGYAPGSRNELALVHLAWAYALVPCLLKLLAAFLLYVLLIRQQPVAIFTSEKT